MAAGGAVTFTLDVGAWEAAGPTLAADFDELIAFARAAKATALSVAEGLS